MEETDILENPIPSGKCYLDLNRARIRTSTRDPALRLLYVGIALILRNVWVWLHQMVLARPRRGSREIRLDLLRFRRMLLWLTHVVEGTLGIRDSVSVTFSFDQEL